MATTKPKEVSASGKEKVPSSNSHATSTKKTKPSTRSSPIEKATSTQSEKQVPNYLKPTMSSRVESQSFKLRKSDAPQKPNLNRRRSLDYPPSASRLPKETHPSHPSLHKTGVSPSSRERTESLRSSSSSVKGTASSKPISERTSKPHRDGKTNQTLLAKNVRKSSPGSSTIKKVATDDGSARSTDRAPKSAGTEAAETENVEAEQEVKEATNEEAEEVIKEEDEERVVDSGSEVPRQDENSEHEFEDSDHQPQIKDDDDEVIIPKVPEEEEEEANAVVELEEAKQEKAGDERDQEENTNPYETSINNESHREEQPETKEVIEAEVKEEGGVTEEQAQTGNDTNEEVLTLEKKEEGISKDKAEEHVESGAGVKEARTKATETQQQKGSGKAKESQTQNDVIEEAASTLLARKNKVRALAGAFQTVIDHQFK